MELLWECRIGGDEEDFHFLWSQTFERIFILGHELYVVHAAFPNNRMKKRDAAKEYIVCERFDKECGSMQRHAYPVAAALPHPANWGCEVKDNALYVNIAKYGSEPAAANMFGKILRITDTEIRVVGDSPPPIERKFPDATVFSFGQLNVSMESPMRMRCVRADSGETVWSLRLTAYLYTPIEERNGTLFFGTAGKGGRFYGVEPATGKVICNIDTGGSTHYAWNGGYVCMKNRTGDLVVVDPFAGAVEHTFKLKHKLCDYSPLLVSDDKLFTMLTHRGKQLASIAAFAF